MDIRAAEQFDRCLTLFVWPNITSTDIQILKSPSNFDANNYKDAVGTYINWRDTILNQIESDERDNLHVTLAQLTFNIIHANAPNHLLFMALTKY